MKFRIGGVEFGGLRSGIFVTKFDHPSPSLRTERADRPMAHGTYAGPDWFGAATWMWDLVTDGRRLADAHALAGALGSAWWSHLPGESGEMRELEYCLDDADDTWKVVYGRPVRFDGAGGDILSMQGAARMAAAFEVLDPLHYSRDVSSTSVMLTAESSGGIIFPVIFPLVSTISSTPSSRFITVGGSAPAPLEVTFHGPVTDPAIVVAGVEVGLVGDVAGDLPITVDARTGEVTRADGVPMPGILSRRSRLAALRVSPGTHEISFSGYSPTGTARVDVAWRPATWGL